MPLLQLTWPILVENLLRVALSSADVFMLSFYSEKAVAATGLITQFVFFIQLLYLMVASGASILISQNLGARKNEQAGLIALGSIVLGILFALVTSAGMCGTAQQIVGFYKLEPQVHTFALQYLLIYSGGSVFVALSMVLGTILRAHGHSREPMIVNVIAMLFNVLGNYLFLFGPFGIPVLGVVGVALSTVISQVIACILLVVLIRMRGDLDMPLGNIFRVPKQVYRQILEVGVPTAGENFSYNLGQIVIMRMVASLGTEAMAATVYAFTILRFVFITSISIGNGTQIKVGYFVGAGCADDAQHRVFRYFGLGFLISLVLVIIVNLFQSPLLDLFTKNAEIHHLIAAIFLVALVLEPGRNFNVIIIPALKGAGDVRFPVYVGMIFMWGIGVLFAYLLGISLGWGLMGVWIALAMDEWIRGLVMLQRWRKGKWKTKVFVKREAAQAV